MRYVNSTIELDNSVIRKLNNNAITALEMTAEAIHTDVVQAEVMPFDVGVLQQDNTFVDISNSRNGEVRIVSSTPYARRLYFHPEYNYQTEENTFAGGEWFKWWLPDGIYNNDIKKHFRRIYKRLNR